MRSLLFIIMIAACAPATRPGTVNVAVVRSEINGTIRSSTNDRAIHSMGKVTPDRAVVYTTSKDGATKQEETWVRDGNTWKLENSAKISANATN
ncbi:MAG TPA: hypothetical protein VIV40_39695 [Kofleriaceae bacterium]